MYLVLFALTSLLATRTTVSAGTPVCFPNEDLEDCVKRHSESEDLKKDEEISDNTGNANIDERKKEKPCLGVDPNNKGLGFLGKCLNVTSTCGTFESDSLNSPFTSTCCYKPPGLLDTRVITIPAERPVELNSVDGDNFEHLNQPNCGQIGLVPFVLGGNDVPEGSLPFMVSFTHNLRPERGWDPFCGGALIAPDMVLTAAHCFDELPLSLITDSKKIRVKVGISDINKDYGSWKENRTRVATIGRVIKYSDYRDNLRGYLNPFNDIAIVKLNNTRGEKKYACLPTSIPDGDDEDNDSSIVTGWGRVDPQSAASRPDVLQYAFIKRWSKQECRDSYHKLLKNVDEMVDISKNMLCAGGNKTDSCKGDSGSPMLQYDSKSRFTVAGIVSFGPSVCGAGTPGVFTKVKSYLPWIKSVLESES